MRKLFLLAFVFVITCCTNLSAQTEWYVSEQAHIGYKTVYETDYTYSEYVSTDKIKIKIEPSEVVIYSKDMTYLRILGQSEKGEYAAVFQAMDQNNAYCNFTVGYDKIADSLYMSVQYPTYILFYYLYEK